MPDLPCRGGGGGNPTSMAQNDTHVMLIILTTQMGGGGGIIGGKNFFGPNFVFLFLWRQHPFLHKTKGPTRNPISQTPPPLLRRASMSPPSAEQFSGRPTMSTAPDLPRMFWDVGALLYAGLTHVATGVCRLDRGLVFPK